MPAKKRANPTSRARAATPKPTVKRASARAGKATPRASSGRAPERGAPRASSGRAPERGAPKRPASSARVERGPAKPARNPAKPTRSPARSSATPTRGPARATGKLAGARGRASAPRRAGAPRPPTATVKASYDTPLLPRPLELELGDTSIRGRKDDAVAGLRVALAAFDAGEHTKALRAARAAKEAAPRSPSVREALGLIYHALGSHKEALSELLASRRMNGSPYQLATIAECYIALGRPERALEELAGLDHASVPPEVWADAQVARARAHAELDNLDAAIGVLRNADEWPSDPKPYHARVRYALADMLARAGQREESRRMFVRLAMWNRDYRDVVERAR